MKQMPAEQIDLRTAMHNEIRKPDHILSTTRGWRIEIACNISLIEAARGAARDKFRLLNPKAADSVWPRRRYGGYYTGADIREVATRKPVMNARHPIEKTLAILGMAMAYPQFRL